MLFRSDRDGHLFITGRIKEMLIISGENVFPREIEEVLNRHATVKDSAVIGMSDPSRGEVPIRGRAAPLAVLRVEGRAGVARRIDAAARRGTAPFVGRTEALDALLNPLR